jgi:hypothetical protein
MIRIDVGKLDEIEEDLEDQGHRHAHRPSVIDQPPIKWPSI